MDGLARGFAPTVRNIGVRSRGLYAWTTSYEKGVAGENNLWIDVGKQGRFDSDVEMMKENFSRWARTKIQLTDTRPKDHREEEGEEERVVREFVILNENHKWSPFMVRQSHGPYVVVKLPEYPYEKHDPFFKNTFAVSDALNPRRIFFGRQIQETLTDYKLVGGICYFDKNKPSHVSIFDEPLFNFDFRNGAPLMETVHLYGNTLTYTWQHRDLGHDLRVEGWVMDEEDTLKGRFNLHLGDQIKQKRVDYQPDSSGRWLTFLEDLWYQIDDHTLAVAIDIPSIRRGDHARAVYDRVTMPAKELAPFDDGAFDMSPALQDLVEGGTR